MQKPIIKQKGAALIIFAVILALAAAAFLVSQLDRSGVKIERDKKTAAVMAEAKTALIGSAASTTNIANPSYLPNPDLKLSAAIPEGSESGVSGAVDISLIGKFPWRSLGVPPLREGWNECLWYVVSGRYKKSPGTTVFNWDTQGQIDVIDKNGNMIASNLAALIVAPGFVLEGQNRALADPTYKQCGGNYDVKNYLDTYDNANAIAGEVNYFAGSTNNRQAPNSSNKTFVLAQSNDYNDQFLFVTTDEIFRPLIRRNDFTAQISSLLDDVEFKVHLQTIVVAGGKGTSNVDCSTIIASTDNKLFCDNWSEMLLLTQLPSPSAITIDGVLTAINCTKVLIFGGQKINMQLRLTSADKSSPANYLEDPNLTAFATPIANNSNFNGVSSFDANDPDADVLRCL